MFDLSNERMGIPKNLEECRKIDSITVMLNQWAMRAMWIGVGAAVLLFFIGIFSGAEAADNARRSEETEAFFAAFFPLCVDALIVVAVTEVVVMLTRALASIVFNTTIIAKVTLMHANYEECGEEGNKEINEVGTQVPNDSVFGIVSKKIRSKAVSKLEDELY